MNVLKLIKTDYFHLFVKREGTVVLGKNYSNFWILTLVLVATFLAIAFSNGSMKYLQFKMDDPFINWVDIQNEYNDGDFDGLSYALSDEEAAQEYHYQDFQSDYQFSYFFFGKEDDMNQYLKCRFFGKLNSELVQAILSEDNVVGNVAIEELSTLSENSIGVIITADVLEKLGYAKAPSYIDLYAYSPGADTLGFTLDHDRARAPLPLLGVVKKLPGNVDLIGSRYFYEQATNDITHPFNLSKPEYAHSLNYSVPAQVDIEAFKNTVLEAIEPLKDTLEIAIDEYGFYPEEQLSYIYSRDGGQTLSSFISVNSTRGEIPYDVVRTVNETVMDQYAEQDVHRLYDYQFRDQKLTTQAYISVHFNDLNNIGAFETFVNQFRVKIEMSQINAKENFNAVSIMANILSWAMIAFAIICIVLFIVNLLKSYFQKVKRNLGTFKAFGISNTELISVYLMIMLTLVGAAVLISLIAVYLIQLVLPLLGIIKEGDFNYLSLWNMKTMLSTFIIITASVFTVWRVMQNMLKLTPGDLIYDRD